MLNRAVLPGSFNPLHLSHLAMAHYAEARGAQVIFEISYSNVDKDTITEEEKLRRLSQFDGLNRDVIFTNRRTFVQKCYIARFCGELYEENNTRSVTFLIGSDTLSRIQDKKYYFDSEKEMERCLAIIAKSGCDFCVFERNGRVEPHPIISSIVEYADVAIPNISSTQIRNTPVCVKTLSKGDRFIRPKDKHTIYQVSYFKFPNVIAQYHEEFFTFNFDDEVIKVNEN